MEVISDENGDQKATTTSTRITDLAQIRPPTRHGPEERTECTPVGQQIR